MDKDSVVFVLLNLLISFVVPFATVWFAQRLGQREAKRQRASEIFGSIDTHTLKFRHAIVAFWRATMEGPLPNLSEDEFKSEKRERQKWKHVVAREYSVIHTGMNGDIRQLRFLFGDKARPLIDVMHDMMTMHEAFDLKHVPSMDEFDKRASQLTHEVADEINRLWDSLR